MARRERERDRPNSSARGYGSEHRRLRERWAPRVDRGEVSCARCGRPIVPGEQWDLGHHDQDRTVYTGPEHQRCNRATSGRKAAPRRERRRQSRAW